jgi:hypothetical protein
MQPPTKLAALKARWDAGDRAGALAIAARFPRLDSDADAIRRGHDARLRPAFYRAIKRDPDALTADAYAALARRYGLAL